jgi:hypothetical protein
VLYWECKRRLNELEEFRGLVDQYFNNLSYGRGRRTYQNEESFDARQKINLTLQRIGDSCSRVGQPMVVNYSDPRTGYQTRMNLLLEIFDLRNYQIPNSRIIDCLDRTIGTYQRRTRWLYWQMFNPFFWIYWLLEKVMDIPFKILEAAGFDYARMESSILGKTAKAIAGFAAFLAAVLTILQLVGWLDPVLKWSHLRRSH